MSHLRPCVRGGGGGAGGGRGGGRGREEVVRGRFAQTSKAENASKVAEAFSLQPPPTGTKGRELITGHLQDEPFYFWPPVKK